MNREQFEARLNELLDRRIAPEADPEVLRVAEQFTECREVLAAYRALFDGVAEMDLPRPPADLARNVMVQWRREKVTGRYLVAQRHVVRGATSRSALFAAAAALLLVGPGLGWLWQRSATSQAQATHSQQSGATSLSPTAATPTNSVAANSSPAINESDSPVAVSQQAETPAAPADAAPAPRAEIAAAPAAAPPKATAPRTTPSTLAAGQIASLLGPGQRPSGDKPHLGDSIAADENGAAGGADTSAKNVPSTGAAGGAAWVGEVSQGFQPIAESAAGALDFLLEVLADGSDDTRG